MSDPVWLYWGHDEGMNDLRWLSLASVCHFHEDVRLVLRKGQSTGHGAKWKEGADTGARERDYGRLPNLTTMWLEDIAPEVAALQLPEAQTSDMLAWFLLANHGGWVADMDILFHAPLPARDKSVGLVQFTGTPKAGYIPVTIMHGRPCKFWRGAWRTAQEGMDPERYESCGSEVLERNGELAIPLRLPEQIVFPFAGMEWGNYRRWLWKDWPGEIPGGCIGTHWYAGNNQKPVAKFDIANDMGLIAKQARRLLDAGIRL